MKFREISFHEISHRDFGTSITWKHRKRTHDKYNFCASGRHAACGCDAHRCAAPFRRRGVSEPSSSLNSCLLRHSIFLRREKIDPLRPPSMKLSIAASVLIRVRGKGEIGGENRR